VHPATLHHGGYNSTGVYGSKGSLHKWYLAGWTQACLLHAYSMHEGSPVVTSHTCCVVNRTRGQCQIWRQPHQVLRVLVMLLLGPLVPACVCTSCILVGRAGACTESMMPRCCSGRRVESITGPWQQLCNTLLRTIMSAIPACCGMVRGSSCDLLPLWHKALVLAAARGFAFVLVRAAHVVTLDNSKTTPAYVPAIRIWNLHFSARCRVRAYVQGLASTCLPLMTGC